MTLKKFFGDKAFYKKMFAVMIPILIQNVITNFVSLLDNIMVGQIGTVEMAGVAIVNQLIFIFNLFIFGGLAGAGVLSAQYYGKNDVDGIRYSFRIKAFIAACASLLFLIIFGCFSEPLIIAYLHEGNEGLDINAALVHAKSYMRIMLWQFLPFALTNLYASTLRETEKTLPPMVSGLIAVFVNLVLNYILIFGKFGFPALGVKGAAIATVVSRFAELAVVLLWTHFNIAKCPFIVSAYRSLKVPKKLIAAVVKLGFPLLCNEVLWAVGMATLNRYYSVRGIEVVSAVNIATMVSNLFFCTFLSMGTTVSIIVGMHLGAGNRERAIDENRKLLTFSVLLCALVGAIMAIIAPLIPELYNTEKAVKDIATGLLLVCAAMMPVNAFTYSCYFAFRSGGKSWITFAFDSGYVWAVGVPAAYLLTSFTSLSITAVYLTVNLLDLIKCIFGSILLKKGTWANNLVENSKNDA